MVSLELVEKVTFPGNHHRAEGGGFQWEGTVYEIAKCTTDCDL